MARSTSRDAEFERQNEQAIREAREADVVSGPAAYGTISSPVNPRAQRFNMSRSASSTASSFFSATSVARCRIARPAVSIVTI